MVSEDGSPLKFLQIVAAEALGKSGGSVTSLKIGQHWGCPESKIEVKPSEVEKQLGGQQMDAVYESLCSVVLHRSFRLELESCFVVRYRMSAPFFVAASTSQERTE